MLLFWRIRYFDTPDRQFRDRDLWLDTSTLEPTLRAELELCLDLRESASPRHMLRYRNLFREENLDNALELSRLTAKCSESKTVFVRDYFEDENGKELTTKQLAVLLTGSPTAIMLPPGATQNDIDFILSDRQPIQIDKISLTQDQLRILGYFTRDLKELLASTFYRDGPGTLSTSGNARLLIHTAVTDEEIRSFVTIFRRLYMSNEPANFVKAAKVFADAVRGNSFANWVEGVAGEYEAALKEKPTSTHFGPANNCTFSRKRLIDVHLYTQYAHQPDSKATKQYQECLASVGGNSSTLTWSFLTELWHCAMQMDSAGKVIAGFYDHYCKRHQIAPEVLPSISNEHPGIGTLEKKELKRTRIIREKAEELATMIWEQNGRPEGGASQFLQLAQERLEQATK